MKNKVKRVVLYVVLVLLIIVFAISTFVWTRNIIRSTKEKKANRDIAKIVEEARRDLETVTDSPEGESDNTEKGKNNSPTEKNKTPIYASSGVLYQYDALWQRNHDMVGWLEISGTNIAYPVMFTPNYIETYLRKAFDGSYAISGMLFLGAGWEPDGNFGIIYGHNMDDGAMFGHLLDYYSDFETAKNHRTIEFDTLTQLHEYELVAAFYSRIYSSNEENVFRYYDVTGLPDEESFNMFLEEVRREAIYDTGIDVEWGDKLLVLSTCSYHTTDGRFAVVARYRPPNTDSN